MLILQKLFDIDKSLYIAHRRVKTAVNQEQKFFLNIHQYLDDYISYHSLKIEDLYNYYMSFIKRYSKDIKIFNKDNKYPHEYCALPKICKIEYDIALILSVFFSTVRAKIMIKLVNVTSTLKNEILLVGIGSGIDLHLINNCSEFNSNIHAYDIKISNFLYSHKWNNVQFIEQPFTGCTYKYDTAIAIEFLEHLSDPFDMLKKLSSCLVTNGKMIFTTATNMPQFDHLYNFNNDNEVDNLISKLGFKFTKDTYPHNYINEKIKSKNTFYVASRTT